MGNQYKLSACGVYQFSCSKQPLSLKWTYLKFTELHWLFNKTQKKKLIYCFCTVSSVPTQCDNHFPSVQLPFVKLGNTYKRKTDINGLCSERYFSSLVPVTEGRGRGKFELSQKTEQLVLFGVFKMLHLLWEM